jgi:hypothetical protein
MLKKLVLRPGVNRETTRHAAEGGWYETDKVRFRQGLPEKIGGWARISNNSFLGACRSLWSWTTLSSQSLRGLGTHLKFYVERGGQYYDITPIRASDTLIDPFDTTSGSDEVLVTHPAHGAITGDFVIFDGATAVGGLTIGGEYSVFVVDVDSYKIIAETTASSTANGGGTVDVDYLINIGEETAQPVSGWGAGGYGLGGYGIGTPGTTAIRLWSQSNFGEDLIFAYRGGKPFYWDASVGTSSRGSYLEDDINASDVPTRVNLVLVSDISRFVFAFGCDDVGSTPFNPMRVRWSDQESAVNWTPSSLNQSGSLDLSRGSEIVTALQARQEVLVWTDSALYSLQFVGAPVVWGAQLLGDNLSIISQNAAVFVNGTAFWMGRSTFYVYAGNAQQIQCDLKRYVFNDFNYEQADQVFAGSNERFNEVWWFYCSKDSTRIDRYVVYNYAEQIWYHGAMARTAWLDSGVRNFPTAATYSGVLVEHENGNDDAEASVPLPLSAYIESSQFNLDDGDRFIFIRQLIPDVTFDGSESNSPSVTVELRPQKDPGLSFNNPLSVGGTSSLPVTRTSTVVVEQFTPQLNLRVRGRQMTIRVSSNQLGVRWQWGAPLLDQKADGGRG